MLAAAIHILLTTQLIWLSWYLVYLRVELVDILRTRIRIYIIYNDPRAIRSEDKEEYKTDHNKSHLSQQPSMLGIQKRAGGLPNLSHRVATN